MEHCLGKMGLSTKGNSEMVKLTDLAKRSFQKNHHFLITVEVGSKERHGEKEYCSGRMEQNMWGNSFKGYCTGLVFTLMKKVPLVITTTEVFIMV